MTAAPVQLTFEGLPLDPYALAQISIFERREIYDACGLCVLQRQAVEEAVRLVVKGEYRRARP